MAFSWVFEDASGQPIEPAMAPSSPFPTQADAESWVGESWRDLLAAGVEQVRLREDEDELYGPMSLRPIEQ